MRLKLKVQIKLKHTEKETLLETKFENYIWKYFFFQNSLTILKIFVFNLNHRFQLGIGLKKRN